MWSVRLSIGYAAVILVYGGLWENTKVHVPYLRVDRVALPLCHKPKADKRSDRRKES